MLNLCGSASASIKLPRWNKPVDSHSFTAQVLKYHNGQNTQNERRCMFATLVQSARCSHLRCFRHIPPKYYVDARHFLTVYPKRQSPTSDSESMNHDLGHIDIVIQVFRLQQESRYTGQRHKESAIYAIVGCGSRVHRPRATPGRTWDSRASPDCGFLATHCYLRWMPSCVGRL